MNLLGDNDIVSGCVEVIILFVLCSVRDIVAGWYWILLSGMLDNVHCECVFLIGYFIYIV